MKFYNFRQLVSLFVCKLYEACEHQAVMRIIQNVYNSPNDSISSKAEMNN